MLKCSASLLRPYQKATWHAGLPKHVKGILIKNVQETEISNKESNSVLSYYMNCNDSSLPTFSERSYVIKYLYDSRSYENLITLGKKLLFDNNGNQTNKLRKDVSINELKSFISAFVLSEKTILLDKMISQIISEWSLTNKGKVVKILNSAFKTMAKSPNFTQEEILNKWTKWMLALNGHCEFTNYMHYKYILRSLLYYFRENENPANTATSMILSINHIRKIQGASAASQLTSTLIYLFTYNKNYTVAEQLWNYKVDNEFPIRKTDLTSILKAYCHFGNFALVKSTHNKYLEAHDDLLQFDYLLIAHSKEQNWSALQQEFDSLFGIGGLPNIRQYGIVMYSMANIGEFSSVEKLYTQLLRRGMVPTYVILQSLLYAYYKVGDLHGCFAQFENFKKHGVQPSASTYSLMFKVHRGLNNIDSALRLLKKITEENKVIIAESHISILISMCSKFTNHLIAQELFDVMVNHYDIIPSGKSVAALMDVYIESCLPQKALHLFKEYAKINPVKDNLIYVYNKSIEAHLKMNQQIECESLFQEVLSQNLVANEEFYSTMMKYLVKLPKDYEMAENVINQLLEHPTINPNSNHFEILMRAYDKISYHDGVFKLYNKLIENKIPVSSKILHYLIRATFKVQIQTNGSLESSIDLVKKIMNNTANRTLDVTFSKLHPSVVAWPMRAITKYSDPSKALELLNEYNNLFYEKDGLTSNNRFSIMRSLLVIAAELEQWDKFENIFEKYISQIQKYNSLPSATLPNKKNMSLLSGIFSYKIRHLIATHAIEDIPEWLERIKKLNLVIDNHSWNKTILVLFQDSRTIEFGMKLVNEKFIHGYNLIHKWRHLKNLSENYSTTKKDSWFLERKKEDIHSFQPSLYIKSEVYEQITEATDCYLNGCDDTVKELGKLIKKYPYFMKNYLMIPRVNIKDWESLQSEYSDYLEIIRSKKRIPQLTETSLS